MIDRYFLSNQIVEFQKLNPISEIFKTLYDRNELWLKEPITERNTVEIGLVNDDDANYHNTEARMWGT